MAKWLQDKNGAILNIEHIVGVTPLEQRQDKRDQTKVTAVYAAIGLTGGQWVHTSLNFDDVVELVNPDPPADPPSA